MRRVAASTPPAGEVQVQFDFAWKHEVGSCRETIPWNESAVLDDFDVWCMYFGIEPYLHCDNMHQWDPSGLALFGGCTGTTNLTRRTGEVARPPRRMAILGTDRRPLGDFGRGSVPTEQRASPRAAEGGVTTCVLGDAEHCRVGSQD